MVEIILVRHGETEFNDKEVVQGQKNVNLNETGVKQAEKLAQRLKDRSIDVIYSSTLRRSINTAEKIAEKHDLSLRKSELINELSLGVFEGDPSNRLSEQVRSFEDIYNWKPENGESMRQAEKRVKEFISKIKNRYSDQTVLVVAHGGPNRLALMQIMDLETEFFFRIKQENTCINELKFQKDRGWRIKTVNDTAHLM